MPGDRVSYGAFAEIADRTERDLRAIIEEVAARPNRPRGSPAQQIADLYTSVVDEARLEQLGAAPIQPELRRIDAIRSARDLAAEAGYLSSIAAGGPFGGTVGIDPLNPGAPVVARHAGRHAAARSRLLPEGRCARSRASARKYRSTSRASSSWPDAPRRQTTRGRCSRSRRRWRASSGPKPRAATRARPTRDSRCASSPPRCPGFDWAAWAKPQGIDRSPAVILAQPSFFKAFAAMVPRRAARHVAGVARLALRHRGRAVPEQRRSTSPASTSSARSLTGQELPRTRWKRGVSMVNGYLGDAIGKLYVEKHFPPDARGPRAEDARQRDRRLPRRAARRRVAEPAGPARGARQAVGALDRRRLSGTVARLQRADDQARRSARQLAARAEIREPVPPGQRRRHGRRRMGDAAADGQRVLQRRDQRDRAAGRDPAAAALRPGGGRRGELRRGRGAHRATRSATPSTTAAAASTAPARCATGGPTPTRGGYQQRVRATRRAAERLRAAAGPSRQRRARPRPRAWAISAASRSRSAPTSCR